MIGVIVLTVGSWLLFKFILKKDLFTNWFAPLKLRRLEILVGFGITIVAFVIPLAFKTLVFSIDWQFNSATRSGVLASAFYFYLKSILFEELVFRGAILSILAYFTKNRTAILVSAICFGMYHWFSYGMFGSGIVPMAYIFLLTGSMGFVWAYIYIKTNSIIMPSVIHLSWNFFSSLFLDYQPFGQLLFQSNASIQYPPFVDFGIKFTGELFSVFLIFGLFQLYFRYKKRADFY